METTTYKTLSKERIKTLAARWRKWAKTLESGKYRQGDGYLCQLNNKNQKQYCCLGVISHTEKLKPVKFSDDGVKCFRYAGLQSELSKKLQKKLGINNFGVFTDFAIERVGKLLNQYHSHSSLADLNDSGVCFKDIAKVLYSAADYLEQTGESYFVNP